MKDLRIAYLNVCGFTQDKWDILVKYVGVYDLVFVAETWYIDQEKRMHFPLILASTYPSKVYPGWQHHGLLYFCSPTLRPLVSQIRVSEFSVSVTVLGHTILGIYAPPGLSCHRFTAVLTGWSPPSVIVGDMNVRFGPSWGDTSTGPSERL